MLMICTVITDLSQPDFRGELAELRLDLFPTIDLVQLSDFIQKAPVPLIATLRSTPARKEPERLRLLEKIAALNPDWIDVESHLPPDFLEGVPTIRSYHNFEHTPDNLEAILENMPKAAYYKIATFAKSSLDALRMMQFTKKHSILGICMGELGQITRITAPLMGAPWTYAGTAAPGQLTIEDLTGIYHYKKLSPSTRLYGLIGDPVAHSLGHIKHNQAFREMGIDALYVKLRVTQEELPQAIPLTKEAGFLGLSVTMPLKERVIPLLDQIDSDAERMGAVNTIVTEQGKWVGYNTDGLGALRALGDVKGKKVTVLGAGGASRAIVFMLEKLGAHVRVLNRTPERAKQLAEEFRVAWGSLEELDDTYDILINTTSHPMPVPSEKVKPGATVMDIKTKEPIELVNVAKSKGCHVVSGVRMWEEQAILQWQLWGCR